MAKIDVSALAVQAKDDPALMLDLWEAVARLVGSWAFKYTRYSQGTRLFDADDLIQAGYLALADAVNGYDPNREASFVSYFCLHVRRRFAEVAGRYGKKHRPEVDCFSLDMPLADDADQTRADMLADPTAEFADDVIDRTALCQDCADLLAEADKLPDKQRRAFLLTCWDDLTSKEAAGVMGEPNHRHIDNWRRWAAQKIRHSKAGRMIAADRYAVHHVGLREFKTTWTSEIEKHILWMEDRGRLEA